MDTYGLTRRQVDVLLAIDELTVPRGPTIRELQTHLDLGSSSTAYYHAVLLRSHHLVEDIGEPGESRNATLTERGRAIVAALREQMQVAP